MKKLIIATIVVAAIATGSIGFSSGYARQHRHDDHEILESNMKCTFCNGTGFRGDFNCNFCKGTGRNSSY